MSSRASRRALNVAIRSARELAPPNFQRTSPPSPFPAGAALQSLPAPPLAATRDELRAYVRNGWEVDDALFEGLAGDDAFLAVPWHGLRRPQVFYYGHSAAFFVNKLRMAGLVSQSERPDPELEELFEVGVDEMPWDDMGANRKGKWPALGRVREFRARARALVECVVDTHPGLAGPGAGQVAWDSPLWALFMGAEHQRIHVETSSVLFRELPLECVRQPAAWPAEHPSASAAAVPPAADPVPGRDFPEVSLVAHGGGLARLGKARASPTYGWDLEYGSAARQVAPFAFAAHLVSNGALWPFVADGGYGRRDLWDAEGWAWREANGIEGPPFWVRDPRAPSRTPRLRAVFSELPMQWAWPVLVTRHEATAFCRWLSWADGREGPGEGYRLPTEAEHALLRDPEEAGPGEANWHLAHGSEGPVDAWAPTAAGAHDVCGNAWEHCADPAAPLDGFEPHALYEDYSATSFGGDHYTLLGGSFATTGAACSPQHRSWFRPHFVQHAGFRVVRPMM